MASTAEEAFVTVVQHLKSVAEDVEEMGATKEVIARLQEEIVGLLKRVMKETDIPSIPIPSSLYNQLTRVKLSEGDSVIFDWTGVLHVKSRASEIHQLQEYSTDTVINLFNAMAPILREEVGKKKKAHESRLEALQALKAGLADLEKKKPPK